MYVEYPDKSKGKRGHKKRKSSQITGTETGHCIVHKNKDREFIRKGQITNCKVSPNDQKNKVLPLPPRPPLY